MGHDHRPGPGGGSLPEGIESRLTRFTDLVANAQARDDLRGLANEQAALRRVATLVAESVEPDAVFDAVCAEAGRLLGAASVNLVQFTVDGYNLTRSGWSLHDTHVPTGTRLPIAPDTINWLLRTSGAPAPMDSYEQASGALGTLSPEPALGSALRVEALGSRLLLDSPVGGSTKVEIELPLGLHASSLT